MQRVALVAPTGRVRAVLSSVGRSGQLELDAADEAPGTDGNGSAGMDDVLARMVRSGPLSATTGWCPAARVAGLARSLAPLGGSLVRLPTRPGSEPPTLILGRGTSGVFQPLVDTYGTVPYRDLNPSSFAGLSYILMFGMMFGDVGHGLLLLGLGLMIRRRRPARLAAWAPVSAFVIGCGAASTVAGLLYGEAFGPTGLVPVVWIHPLDHPTTLLGVAIVAGGLLLAASYALGTVNRWRESGPIPTLVSLPGAAGAALYTGLAVALLGALYHVATLTVAGAVLAGAGLVAGFGGCLVAAGGRASGALQATVEMFDATLRIGSNTVSFSRLAAFGLTHAALGEVIWSGTTGLWSRGPALWVAAATLFALGNVAAFALEGLVAAVQALRLEYYEMFSRVFVDEGRPFRPWRLERSGAGRSRPGGAIPEAGEEEEASCSPG